jgi:GTPase KRas protein
MDTVRSFTTEEDSRLNLRLRKREGEGFLIVYSTTARATFERIDRFRQQIVRVKDSETVPLILVGNKIDKTDEREVSKEEGQAMARKLNCELSGCPRSQAPSRLKKAFTVETSAKTRVNLELAY